jgi:DNA-directed RNA polymerase specialized sigma subunit
MEIWKDIEGWQGMFKISNFGRVKSLERFNTLTRKGTTFKSFIEEKILRISTDKVGYKIISLESSLKQAKKTYKIHRLVAIHFIQNPENKPMVNHKNGIKSDNRVENLEWSTSKENCVHAHENNLVDISKGENHYRSKLTERTVFEIKYGKFEGMSHSQIGKMFGIKRLQVLKIRNGINWKHI